MKKGLPPLRVVENHLPARHRGAELQVGTVLAPRDVDHESEPDLDALYAPLATADPALPHVRANFVSTLDGSVIGENGRSGSINGLGDLRVFQLLRAQADAVFVGAGTARIEGYQDTDIPEGLRALRKSKLQGPSPHNPQLITVTRSGDLHPNFLKTNPLVITAHSQPAAKKLSTLLPAENLLIFGEKEVDFPATLRHLRASGFKEILCEGGPHLFGSLLKDHLVSELCLSFSPKLVSGPGTRIVVGDLTPTTARPQVLLSDPQGFLMGRWLLQPQL